MWFSGEIWRAEGACIGAVVNREVVIAQQCDALGLDGKGRFFGTEVVA